MSRRREISEPCQRCGAQPGEQCIDLKVYQRPGRPLKRTESLHLKEDTDE